jgi:serine/threonine protein kinase
MPTLHVTSGSQKGQTFILRPPGPFRFGRDLDAEFPLFDRQASRRHFAVEFRDEGYSLRDLKSRGGTLLNGLRVESAVLGHGDVIRAGETSFRFELDHFDDPLVGKDLGAYRILEKVGGGGMGSVYRAVQKSLERVVALKVLAPRIAEDPELSGLFVREARAAAELSHPSIVRVYDVNIVDGVLFYAMELMARGTVLDLVAREGALSWEEALAIALEAARAIEYAEGRGLVHRDVKPANLLVHQNGAVKLGDLGIATYGGRDGSGAASTPPAVCGSPHYMAPEQALGRPVDSRADIYALGATLYHLLSGARLFAGRSARDVLLAQVREDPPPLREARPEVPEPVAALVAECLAKDVKRRPQSATVVRRRLEALAAIEKAPAGGGAGGRRALPGPLLGTMALLLGLALGLGGYLLAAFAAGRWFL